ncbi:MAG: histidine phosphatase family protein [Patescibacteria group bacterium]
MRQITIITPGEPNSSSTITPIPLSSRGIAQATKLTTTLESSFDLALCLPVPCALQTAHIISDHTSGQIQEMADPNGVWKSIHGRAFLEARRRLGDASLSEYFQAGAETCVKGVAYRYYRSITQLIDTRDARWTLIVADHIIVPALAMILANHIPEKRFIERTLRPCEGYRLTMKRDDSTRFTVEDIMLYEH